MSGQSICQEIQNKAADITAQAQKDKTDLSSLNNLTSWLNPQNYGAGGNITDQMVSTIIHNNISSDTHTNIVNSCTNSAAISQTNILDTLHCPACNGGIVYDSNNNYVTSIPGLIQIKDCSISNNIQNNSAIIQQQCVLNATIQALNKSTSDVSAQALASAMQNASGLLTGQNQSNSKTCNEVKTDITSNQYLSSISSCANNLSNSQINNASACGAIMGNIQGNALNSFQSCVQNATSNASNTQSADSTVKTETKSSQTTKVNLMIGILIIFLLISISLSSLMFLSE